VIGIRMGLSVQSVKWHLRQSRRRMQEQACTTPPSSAPV